MLSIRYKIYSPSNIQGKRLVGPYIPVTLFGPDANKGEYDLFRNNAAECRKILSISLIQFSFANQRPARDPVIQPDDDEMMMRRRIMTMMMMMVMLVVMMMVMVVVMTMMMMTMVVVSVIRQL